MSTVAVLGAGGGGLSATVELTAAGYDTVLWNRNPDTVAGYRASGTVPYRGVLGSGEVRPALVTTDLGEALAAADVAVACLPSVAHAALFTDLARLTRQGPHGSGSHGPGPGVPLVLNPGHTGAALHARQVFAAHDAPLPPLAEFSTLTYVARVDPDGTVHTTGRAGAVRTACLPGGEEALAWGQRLFPAAQPVADVLAASLSNVNLVLHPPGALLGLAWVEATSGDFTFYVDGMTAGVVEVLSALDRERLAVAAAFGHALPPLVTEMAAIGTVAPDAPPHDPGAAIRGGEANRTIRAPHGTDHRYYREDLPFGLLPFVTLAELAQVPVPTAASLLTLGRTVLGDDAFAAGLDRSRLGLDGRSADDLRVLVRTP